MLASNTLLKNISVRNTLIKAPNNTWQKLSRKKYVYFPLLKNDGKRILRFVYTINSIVNNLELSMINTLETSSSKPL
jgi:hypothetical protein